MLELYCSCCFFSNFSRASQDELELVPFRFLGGRRPNIGEARLLIPRAIPAVDVANGGDVTFKLSGSSFHLMSMHCKIFLKRLSHFSFVYTQVYLTSAFHLAARCWSIGFGFQSLSCFEPMMHDAPPFHRFTPAVLSYLVFLSGRFVILQQHLQPPAKPHYVFLSQVKIILSSMKVLNHS